ncbi:ABC transporter ATP-binding protein [Sphingomonas bacterium]|uniref:ABC transporter ATP-binding protein n=1 Tax=Sphingomonas bacterium TaxID=1895847 RepID=UPI001577218F|nr:ABC transporter ATP-binding protein [Sphingomonas bacterium]
MTDIVAEHVTVRRGGRPIVDSVSLAIESGFVAVIGPNGAGKSTLLSCLAGLLVPDTGAITLDGQPMSAIPARQLARRRAYLPQSPRAEWPVSVERLVALGLMPQLPMFGGLPVDVDERVKRVLTDADLLDRREQPATTLSGGELARAMLARALIGEPDLLIADEPLAGLDPRHAIDGATRLRRLADHGMLVVVSLHDLTLTARHATHVAVIREGRMIAFGPVAATLDAALIHAAFDVRADVIAAGSLRAIVDFF